MKMSHHRFRSRYWEIRELGLCEQGYWGLRFLTCCCFRLAAPHIGAVSAVNRIFHRLFNPGSEGGNPGVDSILAWGITVTESQIHTRQCSTNWSTKFRRHVLCHKEPAQGFDAQKESIKGAYNRSFCAISHNAQGMQKREPIRAKPKLSSTNERGPGCNIQ